LNEEWFSGYDAMLREMENCHQFQPHTMAEIECCFNIAHQYWSRIQAAIEETEFESKMEEIRFYKTVKPLFTSQIEYYNLRYQAEILKPAEDSDEKKEYWLKEQTRLDQFIRDHPVFYVYYKNGGSNRDEEYFLNGTKKNDDEKRVYTDDLISTLLALEKYQIFIGHQLSRD
jgi:hypothetical protein